ncbi:Calx-beta domain-containing protein [Alteromonas macleodii]|uniref:Calx-beta domain-containing protein n=1 Tax=Alteromonas macleodii TaxID=28108 RepID=UPI00207674C3|nr:Calx-beta domain-containing protein [Alteromonas macleodii]USI27916.1 hypothetical protein NFG60_19775 [Alteromonas macleodii]
MALTKNIYVCQNINGCKAASQHDLTLAPAGVEVACPECQSALIDTGRRKINFRGIIATLSIPPLVGVAAWMLAPIINPPKLEHVNFEHTLTRVKEADAVAQISILFKAESSERLVIEYSLFSGTATAGEDFNNQPGQLILEPGQQQGTISIPITPDRNQREANENFEIVLNNVEGLPRHTILIEEEGVNKELLEMSDVLIADLSRLAADIANDYATIKMLEDYIKSSLNPDEQLVARYERAKINILRARERYLLQFNDALDLDPVVIDMSITNRLAAIKRDNAELQYNATHQMQIQLNEYMNTKIPQTDLWIEELGALALPVSSDIDGKLI